MRRARLDVDVFYNGVTLPYAHVHSFAQRSVSDATGTDWMLLDLDMSVTSVLNAKYAATIYPAAAGQAAPTIMKMIRSKLLERRGEIQYNFNGVDLIPALPDGNRGFVDANNGPVPQYCNVSLLTDDTFVIDYRITANFWEDLNATPANNVLSNRWSEHVVIDQHNYSKYNRNGTYIIRSDNPAGMPVEGVSGGTSSAGGFRQQFATLGIRPGCVRQSASYVVSPDGLRMQYDITDQEVFVLPPEPAFEAEGWYTESSPRKTNAKRHSMVHIRLVGSKATIVGDLVRTAVLAAASKMRAGALARNANVVMNSGSVTMQMYRNEVIVEMHGTVYADDNAKVPKFGGMAGINYTKLLDTISTAGKNPPAHAIRGTAGIVLQAGAYWDPNIKQLLNAQTGKTEPGVVPGTAGKLGE